MTVTPSWKRRIFLSLGLLCGTLGFVLMLMAIAKQAITGGDKALAQCITTQTQAGQPLDMAVAFCRQPTGTQE